MARKKRTFNTFNLSFLDIMSCGFGAVVLVFLIMNHAIEDLSLELNENLLAEVNMLDEQVTEGEEGLVQLRNTLSNLDLQVVEAQGLATRIMQEQSEWEAQISAIREDGFLESSAVDELKAEVQQLEVEVEKLRSASEKNSGNRARQFIGKGNRQYLTGLHLGGRNIAILVDTSASMLADKLVQIIRLRNMDTQVQKNADKWSRTLKTVDWITAQLPVASKYQIINFSTEARYVLPATAGKWLSVANRQQLNDAVTALYDTLPGGGTNLHRAFAALGELSPQPDNIFLITDGLPTLGEKASKGSKVSGSERVRLYRQALAKLPKGATVNVILAPLEGDPMAASEFWKLAQATGGSFLSPARDWP